MERAAVDSPVVLLVLVGELAEAVVVPLDLVDDDRGGAFRPAAVVLEGVEAGRLIQAPLVVVGPGRGGRRHRRS